MKSKLKCSEIAYSLIDGIKKDNVSTAYTTDHKEVVWKDSNYSSSRFSVYCYSKQTMVAVPKEEPMVHVVISKEKAPKYDWRAPVKLFHNGKLVMLIGGQR